MSDKDTTGIRKLRTMFRPRPWTLAALWIVIACGNREPHFPSDSPNAGAPDLITGDDVAVYETVMDDMRLGQIFGMAPAPPPPPGSHASVDSELSKSERILRLRPYTASQGEVQPDANRWEDLDGHRLPSFVMPESVLEDFKRRNRHKATLTRFQPKDIHVVWDAGTTNLAPLYSLTLPGYSATRDVAVVEISVATSTMSGGGELVYLRKAGRVWRVVAKQRTWIS